MRSEVVCPACNEVVYPDALVISDHHFGFTYFGLRAKWSHPTFGVVHLCDPEERERVFARDGKWVGNPPWRRILWRHRSLRPLARRLGEREFTTLVLIRAALDPEAGR